jgi:hypothetical protein
MPGPPSDEQKYVVCIEVPGPLKAKTIEEWREMVKEYAAKLGGKVVKVALEKK